MAVVRTLRTADVQPSRTDETGRDAIHDFTGETSTLSPTLAPDRKWLALALLALAQFVVVLDASIVNVALPSIGTALDFSQDNLSWVVNAYTLTFGGFLLLGGRMADLLGRRNLFMAGIVLFGVASLLGGFSTTEGQLIAARALQGLGAALLSPAALSLVTVISMVTSSMAPITTNRPRVISG